MYTVYILQDDEGKIYKGFTSDIARRLKEHKNHGSRTTNMMDKHSLKIIYQEQFENRLDARNREKYLKSSAGRKFLKKMI